MTNRSTPSSARPEKANGYSHAIALVAIVVLFFCFAFGIGPSMMAKTYSLEEMASSTSEAEVKEALDVADVKDTKHLPTPAQVKALYMTSWVAGTPSLRAKLINIVDTTELNSIVIDIKDDTGRVSYAATNEAVVKEGSIDNRIKDLPQLIEELHAKNVYVIGRIAVFQDPYLAKRWTDESVQRKGGGVWTDRKGLSWIDAGSTRYWEYIAALARDASDLGFDEINFDYVRYPTDGTLSDMVFPRTGSADKRTTLAGFFKYINEEMDKSNIVSSADIFGIVTTAHEDMSDIIGQNLEDSLKYFDYVAPMVYPSHYDPGSYGYNNPNDYPYEIVKASMLTAAARAKAMVLGTGITPGVPASTSTPAVPATPRAAGIYENISQAVLDSKDEKAVAMAKKLRPWLQDFDYGGDYDAADVRAQIKATYDSGLDSWFLWNASNVYTKEALLAE